MFRGHGNATAGVVTSPYHLYKYFSENGVSPCTVKNLFVGGFNSFIEGFTSGDPQRFGQSFGTVLIAAAIPASRLAGAAPAGAVGTELAGDLTAEEIASIQE